MIDRLISPGERVYFSNSAGPLFSVGINGRFERRLAVYGASAEINFYAKTTSHVAGDTVEGHIFTIQLSRHAKSDKGMLTMDLPKEIRIDPQRPTRLEAVA